MRLRLRPAPGPVPVPSHWVQPRRAGRSTDVGSLDSAERAQIDPAGLVTLEGRTWSLDWWIGAEDRWHLPAQEVAVRQSLVGSSPVVETRLRVPSGDAVHRAYGARNRDGAEAIVVEVENQSKVPFAVALAIRPHDQQGTGRVASLALTGPVVEVDDEPVVVLPRSPGRMTLAAGSVDSASVVMAGDAKLVESGRVEDTHGLANGAFLFPLAHTATLRVVLPLGGSGAVLDPASFPAGTEVAKGWGTQSGRGTRIEVPDRRLRDAVLSSTRHLLLGARTPATVAGLDLMGFPDEAGAALLDPAFQRLLLDEPGRGTALLVRHFELTGDAIFAKEVARFVGTLAGRALKRSEGDDRAALDAVLPGLAALLEAAGEAAGAADVRALVATDAEPVRVGPVEPSLEDLLGSAVGTWTWPGPDGRGHDPAANAALVSHVRGHLVAETAAGLALSPVVPEPWLGQGWEVHDAPTRHGHLSYAVRWHGDRPALLWELVPVGAGPVTLTVPGLDPTWSTTAAKGDALLAPVALPEKPARKGITMPVTIEPIVRRSDG